jgi:hypothetical protein
VPQNLCGHDRTDTTVVGSTIRPVSSQIPPQYKLPNSVKTSGCAFK